MQYRLERLPYIGNRQPDVQKSVPRFIPFSRNLVNFKKQEDEKEDTPCWYVYVCIQPSLYCSSIYGEGEEYLFISVSVYQSQWENE